MIRWGRLELTYSCWINRRWIHSMSEFPGQSCWHMSVVQWIQTVVVKVTSTYSIGNILQPHHSPVLAEKKLIFEGKYQPCPEILFVQSKFASVLNRCCVKSSCSLDYDQSTLCEWIKLQRVGLASIAGSHALSIQVLVFAKNIERYSIWAVHKWYNLEVNRYLMFSFAAFKQTTIVS